MGILLGRSDNLNKKHPFCQPRDERAKLGLVSAQDYELFLMKFFKFADVYKKIREAENTFTGAIQTFQRASADIGCHMKNIIFHCAVIDRAVAYHSGCNQKINTAEYTDQEEFQRWRNSIGALLLLRKSINASLKDKEYKDKLR